MSYILDALKKAAEQRDAHAPAMQRLFSPAPEITDSPRWRLALVGAAAAVAGAVVAVWVLWPVARVVTDKPPEAPAGARVQPQAAARVQPEAAPPAEPAPPVVRAEPRPAAPPKAAADKRAAPVTAPAVPARPVPVESTPAPTVQTRQAPVESAAARPQPPTQSPVIAAVRPGTVPAVVAPPTPGAPRADVSGPMRLEVIVYSDERDRRLAFINGRKYVEGDTLLNGARVQEIQPNAVVIMDDGRRVVLKP